MSDSRIRLVAICLAAILNILLVVVAIRSWTVVLKSESPPSIPVELVLELPPPPPVPKPPPSSEPLPARQSGPDETTTRTVAAPPAPPPVEELTPTPVPPSDPPRQPEPQEAEPPTSRPSPIPAMRAVQPAPPPKPRIAAIPSAPAAPQDVRPDAQIGETVQTGDPYLNQIFKIVRTKVVYPRRASALGLKGYVTYRLTIDSSGHLQKGELIQGSGAEILDKAAWEAIIASQPFPPPPAGLPPQFGLIVTMLLAPD